MGHSHLVNSFFMVYTVYGSTREAQLHFSVINAGDFVSKIGHDVVFICRGFGVTLGHDVNIEMRNGNDISCNYDDLLNL